MHGVPGPFIGKGSGPDVAAKDFWTDYKIDGSAVDGSSTSLKYNGARDEWTWECEVPKPNSAVPNSAFSMKVTGKVMAPGYFTVRYSFGAFACSLH